MLFRSESGLVREVIRAIQEARKQNNLDVSDRINIQIGANGEVLSAVKKNSELISSEVLATKLELITKTNTDNELGLYLELVKA